MPEKTDFKAEISSYFEKAKASLRAKHTKNRKYKSSFGIELCRQRSKVFDQLISTALEGFGFKDLKGTCVVAVGGYGREELCPYSDIDLLFLHTKKNKSIVKEIVESLVYFLWDLNFDVGHSVRTLKECRDLSYDEDTTILTSLMDSHHVYGDEVLSARLEEMIYGEVLPKTSGKFIERKLSETETRVKKFGGSLYLLEPNVKEGEGGLRDLQSALWIAKAKYKSRDLRGLLNKGVINSKEYQVIERCYNFLLTVRTEMHYQSGRRDDRLSFELQEKVSKFFEYKDSKIKAVEKFMRVYYLRARLTHMHSKKIVEECMATSKWQFLKRTKSIGHGFTIKGGQLSASSKEIFREDPLNFVRAFEYLDKYKVEMSRNLMWMIWENAARIDDKTRRDSRFNNYFLGILRTGKNIADTLFLMNELRVLGHYMPEFGKIVCMVQHDAYHVYTTDVHSIMMIREIEDLISYKYEKEFPLLTKIAESVVKRDVLYLACLIHDVGKGSGKDHAETGALMVLKIAERMGLKKEDTRQLEFLVKQHLIMSHFSQRRDLHDISLIERLAHMLRSQETLNLLYLLTFADIRSVGPDVWTNWKGMLLRELYLRTSKYFEVGGDYTAESIEKRISYLTGRTMKLLKDKKIDKEDVRSFFERLPISYLYVHAPKSIAHHIQIVTRAGSKTVTDLIPHPSEDHDEFVFWGNDEKGLIYKICGVLSASDVNILGARLSTTTDGRVLDVFYVDYLSRSEPDHNEAMWNKVHSNIKGVLQKKLSVGDLVRKRRSSQSPYQKSVPKYPARVKIDNDSSDHSTVIDVYAHDRTGLLDDNTKTLSKAGVNRNYAKISTKDYQAVDVFYVSDGKGKKVLDADKLEKIKNKLMEVLAG